MKIMIYIKQDTEEGKIMGSSSQEAGKGRSRMSENIKHGYHLVEGKMGHAMEDYVFAQFKEVEDNELGLFAIFDGHLSQEVPNYLRSHLFDNILNEVNLCNSFFNRIILVFWCFL